MSLIFCSVSSGISARCCILDAEETLLFVDSLMGHGLLGQLSGDVAAHPWNEKRAV